MRQPECCGGVAREVWSNPWPRGDGMTAARSLSSEPTTGLPLVIDRFIGDHHWLSLFAPGGASFDGVRYPTRAHAYAAAKTLDRQARVDIAAASTPAQAWQIGRCVDRRPDWTERRAAAMWEVLASAFNTPGLAGRLEGTGTALLVEGNQHHNRHWGTCSCPEHQEVIGDNQLGRTLMAIRSVRRQEPPDTWTRAAVIGQGAYTATQTAWIGNELRRVLHKLRQQHGATAAVTAGAGQVELEAGELAQQLGMPVWVYLTAPDHTTQVPKFLAYRHEQLRARAQCTAVLASRPIAGRPGRYADLQQKVQSWILRDCNVVIAIGDRSTTGRATTACAQAKTADQPVITIDPATRTCSRSS